MHPMNSQNLVLKWKEIKPIGPHKTDQFAPNVHIYSVHVHVCRVSNPQIHLSNYTT